MEVKGRLSFSLVKRVLGLLKPHWPAYAAVCVFGVVIACLEMIPPRLVGQAIDGLSNHRIDAIDIFKIAGIWLGLAVGVQVLHALQIRLANAHGERALASLRVTIFERLQRLSMGFYDRTHAGKILTMTGSDVDSIRNVVIWGLNTVVANGAIMLMASIMVYQTDPALFFATVWLAPTMTIVNFVYGKRVTEAWQLVREHSSAVGANQAENIAGVRVVVAFNRQEANLKHFNQLQENNTVNNVMASRKSGLFQPMLQWVRFMGMAIILVFGGYRVSTGALGPGSLVAVILYWEWFMTPAVNFGAFFNDLLIALSGAERVFQLLDEKPEIQDVPGAVALPRLKGDVRFENVDFRYRSQQGRKVLDDVTFDVPAGSMVAVVGETGSGKSTILSLLARFYQPEAGAVKIDGYDIAKASGESLHRQMAIVQQANYLFNTTVIENLRYARPGMSEEEVYEAARRLGCHERFLAMKDGYNTRVGEKGSALSLGERQLVCFTRALVADPSVLLLDEATSALDPVTSHQVQAALKKLVNGRTTFVVTHRMSTAREADLVLVVDNGRVIESGSHKELVNRGGKYAGLVADSLA
jgi:ABC-type multidrug transport system fused ATPase/permease subunit